MNDMQSHEELIQQVVQYFYDRYRMHCAALLVEPNRPLSLSYLDGGLIEFVEAKHSIEAMFWLQQNSDALSDELFDFQGDKATAMEFKLKYGGDL